MSVRITHFDAETGRSSSGDTTQAFLRTEGRHENREGRAVRRTRSGTSDVEPTEVGLSHKLAHGKTNEKAQLKLSKARSHVSSARNDSSHQTVEYVSSHWHSQSPQDVTGSRKMRSESDYSPKATSELYASKSDSGRTKFMANIPGIPVLAQNEQLAQRGDRAGHTPFPPPSVTNYGQHIPYSLSPSSDVKSLPRDSNNIGDSALYKQPANRHPKALRVKGQPESEMQWNATQENNYHPRDDRTDLRANQRNWETSEYSYSKTRARRNKDGGSTSYNDVMRYSSGLANRQHLASRPTRAAGSFKSASLSESPTDSQGSSSESESDISSSPDTSFKRRRRIKRKPSNKSIGSSMYGEDNTSEDSENHSISEISDACGSVVYAQRRPTQLDSEEASEMTFVSYNERQSLASAPLLSNKKLRSSSLTSVSSMEGGSSSRQSPLMSPSVASISRVKKIQIQSFTSFADKKQSNKENRPERRISPEEGGPVKFRGRSQSESTSRETSRSQSSKDGSASPSLSRNPFTLKAKPLRKLSRESLASDSECSTSPSKSGGFDLPAMKEDAGRCSSAPPLRHVPSSPIDGQDARLPLYDSGFGSTGSAFVPVVPSKRTHTLHNTSPPIVSPESCNADFELEKGIPAVSDFIPDPVLRSGGRDRPLSIVQEQDECSEIPEDETFDRKHVAQKLFVSSRSSPVTRVSQDRKSPSDDGTSTLRRLSYVRAQNNSSEIPIPMPSQDAKVSQPWDDGSNSDSPPYSPAFMETNQTPPSPRYAPQGANNEHRVLDEFDTHDPHDVFRKFNVSEMRKLDVEAPVVAEGDLISFDDENGEVKEPVKKRKKKIPPPKIPAILSHDAAGKEINQKDQPLPFQDTAELHQQNGVSLDKDISEVLEGSKRDTIVAQDSDEGSTPKATSDVEENQATDTSHGVNLNQQITESPYDIKEEVVKDLKQKIHPTKVLQKRKSLPLIRREIYQEEVQKIGDLPKTEESAESAESVLRKVETMINLSNDAHHLKVIPYNSGEMEGIAELSFSDGKSLDSCISVPDSIPSPSPSQCSFDAYSLTTSGFSETHSEQISTGDLDVVDDLVSMDGSGNGKSLDAWRSQSDPSGCATNGHNNLLEHTIAEAELKVHRNSNSEPNLADEKLKEESVQLAMRVNGGNPVEPHTKLHGTTQRDDDDKDISAAELSPDECYEFKPERHTKPVQRAKSAPTPVTPTAPRRQQIANAFAIEKAQMKLNKLAAMEPIIEMPHAEPAVQTVIEKPLDEKKRSVSLESSFSAPPTIGVVKEDKKRLTVSGETAKPAKTKHDLRGHVLKNLLDTEKSYVQNLQFLVSNYYNSLKKQDNASIVEPAQVEEMFYQIPEILLCHEYFLQQLQARVNDWHGKQKIGDVFVTSFTKCFLVDAYSAFINHFLQARAAVRVATMSRPSFVRYMEQCSRDHKEKLTLQDLMIMPVQRIPRYELILKDMIKHTPHDHPDHGSLQLALGEIKTLADRMNRGEKEVDQAEREAERLRDLEATIEGMTELVTPTRRLIRQDLVAEVKGTITKKDRCLFLFNDMLACATVKRKAKTNALRRSSLSLFSGSGTEFNKYKLLWRLHLEYVEVIKSSPESQRRNSLEKQLEKLDNDMSSLSKISALADTLNIAHMALDASIRELMNEVNRQISEKQIPLQPPTTTRLELQAQTEEGEEMFQFLFLETEIKNSWEAYFEDAKQKLAYAKDTFPPEFQYCIPINKTRSGMQFTCASPCQVPHMLDRGNHCGSGDVWVCNSDGYVGQVCILSMGSQIQPVASISVCSSRILCIAPVPGTKLIGLESLHSESETKSDTHSISMGSEKSDKVSNQKISRSTLYASDEDDTGAQTIMAFDSSSEDEEGLVPDTFTGGKFPDGSSPMFDGRLSPEGSSLGTTGSADGDMDSSQDDNAFEFDENDTSDDEMKDKNSRKHSKRTRSGSRTASEDIKDSLSDIVNFDTDETSSVWLGTEDGSIFLYPVNEAHSKKTKLKTPHSGSIQCILYVDNQVFISLSTGHLYIYRRQPGSAWEVGSPVMLHIGESAAVSCMTAIHGRLWCGLGCKAVIVNTTTFEIEKSFNCSLDKDRSVYRMASSGMGVWISLQSCASVRLYHATRFECLADVDVAPPVHKMLAGSDAIIRQHKAACLRVTALLACKDLLWIGTSAGVVLTLPLPTITANTASLRCPAATASFHGHTGHVRFLTAVEVAKEGTQDSPTEKGSGTLSSSSSTTNAPLTSPLTNGAATGSDVLIISGGDGYEDFRASSSSESAGRDDSTNHLLIWRV